MRNFGEIGPLREEHFKELQLIRDHYGLKPNLTSGMKLMAQTTYSTMFVSREIYICMDCFGPFWTKLDIKKKEHWSLPELSASPPTKCRNSRGHYLT